MSTTSLTPILQDLKQLLHEACQLLDRDYSCVRHAVVVQLLRESYLRLKTQLHTDHEPDLLEALPGHVILEAHWQNGQQEARARLREVLEKLQHWPIHPTPAQVQPVAVAVREALQHL